jgi:hypothetical protein
MAEDLITGVELSATEHALQRLRAKDLLPSDLTGLGMDAYDPLEGLEVAVSIPLDAKHVAAVFLLEGDLCGGAPLPGVREPSVLGRTMESSRDPYVVAGSLPLGTVRAQVRDGRGAWHEAAAAAQERGSVSPAAQGAATSPFATSTPQATRSGRRPTALP